MKLILVLCVSFLGLSACTPNQSSQLVDYRVLLGSARDVKECSSSGLMCEDCNHLVSCVETDNGSFIKLPVETCPNDETCLGNECTSSPNPRCELVYDLEFPCQNGGLFPNPFDCQRYHFCVPIENDVLNYVASCVGAYAYHAGTTFCQKPLVNNLCSEDINEFPVPICLEAGQSEALQENPSIYYICAEYSDEQPVLYPFLFVCPHGGTYQNFVCS